MPAFPACASDCLRAIVDALRARSKGITYHAPGWTCSCELPSDDCPERLNVDVDALARQMRLSVWADGVMWFRVCRGRGKDGWDLMLAFHGDCTSVSPGELVDLLKASLASAETELLNLWRAVSPQVERSEWAGRG